MHTYTPRGVCSRAISVELDGRIIFDLAKRLKENPGSRLEIGG